MNINQLSSDGRIAYLINPILKVLQEAGGQLVRFEKIYSLLAFFTSKITIKRIYIE